MIINIQDLQELRKTHTLRQIGLILGVSRQRVDQKLHPERYRTQREKYAKRYRQTEKYKSRMKIYNKTYQKIYWRKRQEKKRLEELNKFLQYGCFHPYLLFPWSNLSLKKRKILSPSYLLEKHSL